MIHYPANWSSWLRLAMSCMPTVMSLYSVVNTHEPSHVFITTALRRPLSQWYYKPLKQKTSMLHSQKPLLVNNVSCMMVLMNMEIYTPGIPLMNIPWLGISQGNKQCIFKTQEEENKAKNPRAAYGAATALGSQGDHLNSISCDCFRFLPQDLVVSSCVQINIY